MFKSRFKGQYQQNWICKLYSLSRLNKCHVCSDRARACYGLYASLIILYGFKQYCEALSISYIATITKIIFLVLISSCFYRLFETASFQGDTCSVLFTDDSTTCRVSLEVILTLRFVCHSELSLLYSNHMYDWTRSSYGVYLE